MYNINSYDLADENLPAPLSEEELKSYFIKMYNGDMEAKNVIIIHNLRLVKKIAKSFYSPYYEFDEIFQMGCEALTKCVESFDLSKDICFSTFAVRCIKNIILNYIKFNRKYMKNVSLSEPLRYGDNFDLDICIEDTLVDEKLSFEDELIEKVLIDSVKSCLVSREIEILKMYFQSSYTEQEIADSLNISHQTVSRILIKAKKKIKTRLIHQGYKDGM